MNATQDTGTTGEAIADRILSQLDYWQLSASQWTYDGAGAMAGKRRGAAARITDQYPRLSTLTALLMLSTLCS